LVIFKRSKSVRDSSQVDDWEAEPRSIFVDLQAAARALLSLEQAKTEGLQSESEVVDLYSRYVNSVTSGARRYDVWCLEPTWRAERTKDMRRELQRFEYLHALRGLTLPLRGLHDGLVLLDMGFPEFLELGQAATVVAKRHLGMQFSRLSSIPTLRLADASTVTQQNEKVWAEIETNTEAYDEVHAIVQFTGIAKPPTYGQLFPSTIILSPFSDGDFELLDVAQQLLASKRLLSRLDQVVPPLVNCIPVGIEALRPYFKAGFEVGYYAVRAQEKLGWSFQDPFREGRPADSEPLPRYMAYGGVVKEDGAIKWLVKTDWDRHDYVDRRTWAALQRVFDATPVGEPPYWPGLDWYADGTVPMAHAKVLAFAMRSGVYYGVNENSQAASYMMALVGDVIHTPAS
jgi:hypothetical protein